MIEREKALEAAIRRVLEPARGGGDIEPWVRDTLSAALAMPSSKPQSGSVDRASWEAGRDAAEKAVTGLIESNAHDSYTGRLYALNKAREAIRNLTPPEDKE
jgi:hypothetical protein